MSKSNYVPRRVHIATLQAFKSKAGNPYMRGAFGHFDLLLFWDEEKSVWNLIASENSTAREVNRPMPPFVEVEGPTEE